MSTFRKLQFITDCEYKFIKNCFGKHKFCNTTIYILDLSIYT